MRADTPAGAPADEAARDLAIETRGSLAILTLNRPRALNALNAAMRQRFADAYPRFAREAQIYAVVIEAAGGKAFSAGGDVREMTTWGREDRARARRSFKDEYALNWLHECFSKPTISLIDGAVMGSGVGITLYGTHRVGAERYRFAMPETAIGLFPDVGTAWTLARMPDAIGMYLGLTGRAIGAADAFALGLLTHCIPAAHYEEIKSQIAETWPVDPMLDALHVDPGPRELSPYAALIAQCFSAPSVEEIVRRLERTDVEQRDWAQAVVADLRARAPLSLKVTHRHIRDSRARDLRQTLQVDYRLACRFLEGHDFYEGIRAVIVDKGDTPRWEPATLEAVDVAGIDRYFAPLGERELAL
jgi:enoyl-CoA hydratase